MKKLKCGDALNLLNMTKKWEDISESVNTTTEISSAPTENEMTVTGMPKNKGIYRLFRTKEELQRHDEEIRHSTRVFTLDHVTVALGRMGFRESKFREFDRVLTEVFREYMTDYADDLKDDKSMEYSRACLDRELKQYTGKFFVPEDERYK